MQALAVVEKPMTRWRKVKKATSRILRIRKKKAPTATGPTIDELAAAVKTAVSVCSAALFTAVRCLPGMCALGLWLLRLLCSLRPYGPVLCALCPASVVYTDVRYACMDRRMRSAARAHAHTHTHTKRTTGSAFRKLS